MPYSAKAVANEFLTLANQEQESIPQMKMQKLVYISHGFNLAIFNTPLIDESVQAWKFGPVISTLYDEFKGFGSGPITSPASNMIIDDDFNIRTDVPSIPLDDTRTKELIRAVWDRYKIYSGPNLSDLTHRDNTPWSRTFVFGIPNLVIDNDLISEHYQSMLNGN